MWTVWTAPWWCEPEDLYSWEFTQTFQECDVNWGVTSLTVCVCVLCDQGRVWSVGRVCTERTTPARPWTTFITLAASPVCPVVSLLLLLLHLPPLLLVLSLFLDDSLEPNLVLSLFLQLFLLVFKLTFRFYHHLNLALIVWMFSNWSVRFFLVNLPQWRHVVFLV